MTYSMNNTVRSCYATPQCLSKWNNFKFLCQPGEIKSLNKCHHKIKFPKIMRDKKCIVLGGSIFFKNVKREQIWPKERWDFSKINTTIKRRNKGKVKSKNSK